MSKLTLEQHKEITFFLLLVQSGENLVPEQTNEREEADEGAAAVPHGVSPVLKSEVRDGLSFNVMYKLCDSTVSFQSRGRVNRDINKG